MLGGLVLKELLVFWGFFTYPIFGKFVENFKNKYGCVCLVCGVLGI